MSLLVRQGCFAGIGGVFVRCGRIEFRGHFFSLPLVLEPPRVGTTPRNRRSSASVLGQNRATGVSGKQDMAATARGGGRTIDPTFRRQTFSRGACRPQA